MKLHDSMRKAGALLAAVLLLGGAVPAQAYTAAAGFRAIDLDFRGTRGQVQEYDGKYYKGVHGDLSFGNEGAWGLLDLSVMDIGSTEEAANVAFDSNNGFKTSAKWENMHHRLNFIRTGLYINGVYTPDSNYTMDVQRDIELMIRRTESELNVSKTSQDDSRRWVSLQYWRGDKKGSTIAEAASYTVSRANVDNTKQDVTVGLGIPAGQTAQVAVDLVRSEFDDRAEVVRRTGVQGNIIKPVLSASEMTGGEMRFKFDPRENLAVTGAFTGRRRHALQNDFSTDSAVAALNAAYRPAKSLSLLGKVYFRGIQVNESQDFKALVPGEFVNRSQLDKNELRTDLSATYRPVDKVKVKGAYRLALITRRDAPSEVYTAGYFLDGTFMPSNGWQNDVASQETRHEMKAETEVELPLGMEAELGYKRLQANRPAFVNQPNQADDFEGSLMVPLPADMSLLLLGGYVQEKNKTHSLDRNYSSMRNIYRASLDGSLFQKVFLGADGSWESIRYFADVAFGSAQAALPGTTFRQAGMPNKQNNTTVGLHARAPLPAGFAVSGNGSYTWSRVNTKLEYYNPANRFSVDDYTPYDIRVARGTMALDYTPARWSNLTARASYTVHDWVDKLDNNNTGRVSIAQLGVSGKF